MAALRAAALPALEVVGRERRGRRARALHRRFLKARAPHAARFIRD